MSRLDQIRNQRVEIENWAAGMIQQVMRAFLERNKQRERPETDEGEVKLDTETKTKDVTRNTAKQNNQRFFAMLRQRFALTADVQAGVKSLIAKSEEIMQKKLQEASLAGVPQWKRKALLKQKQRSDKRKRKALKNRVSTRVQAIMRGWMARRAYRMLVKMNMDEKMSMAAIKIQSQARVFTTKQSLKAVLEKHVQCATDIQRVYRGWETREFVNYIRAELRYRMKRLEATVAIQTMYRGFQAKGAVKEIRSTKAAMVLQCAFRSHQAREQMAGKKLIHEQEEQKKQKQRAKAAVKIQSISRGRKAQKNAQKRKKSLARKRAKNAKAASKIQAAQRGRRERKIQQQRHKKATRIQAQIRRRISSKHVEQMQKNKEKEVEAGEKQAADVKEEQAVKPGEEQAVYVKVEGGDDQVVEGGDDQVVGGGEEQKVEGGDDQAVDGGEEPVHVEEKPVVEGGEPVVEEGEEKVVEGVEEPVVEGGEEQVVEEGEEQEGAELPSKAIETETESETVTVDDTPNAEEIAAATKLQRVARGSQARDRVDALRAERRRQLSAEAGETGQRKVKRKKK